MPLSTDFGTNPYWDDYDENKKYYRILFRPTVPVQARELTQLQTIIQNQIERFGNHVFKNGDVVSGCSIMDMSPLPYVRLADTNSNAASFDVSKVVGSLAVSATSNLSARVITSAAGLSSQYPNTNICYLQYINSGTAGEKVFSNNELLTFLKIPATGNTIVDTLLVANTFTSNSSTVTSGNAHGISVTDGIIYINGYFVKIDTTIGIVKPYDIDAGNNVVGFSLTESIVTEDEDESLLDNALGYPNENAPGAHRLRLVGGLVSLDPVVAANTVGFNPIATYNMGSLVTKNSSTDPYSAIGEVLAQRTYEESGNYVLNPFVVDTVSSNTSSSYMYSRVNPGVGYAQGHRVEILKTAYVDTRRGVDLAYAKQQQITFNYGQYIQVNERAGGLDFDSLQTVTLYDTAQKAVTNHSFLSTGPVGSAIGTAKVRVVTHFSGTPGNASAVYNVYLHSITMNAGHSFGEVKSIYYSGSLNGYADLVTSDIKGSAARKLLFSFGKRGTKSLRDSSNNNNSEYVYRKKSSGIMGTDGTITVTITTSSPGGTDILPYGLGNLLDTDTDTMTVVMGANAQTASLSGTVQVFNTANNIVGTSTTFTTSFAPGELIKVGSDVRTVTSVANNTYLTVDSVLSANATGQSYVKFFPAGYVVPLSSTLPGNRYVAVSNTTSFAVHTGQAPTGTVSVQVTHNVLRTVVSPSTKAINKNRFVKIDTVANPKGPWCLGLSDIHRLRKVYVGTTYDVANQDLTSSFVFDTGQRDTAYGLGYLYAKPGVDVSGQKLLVQLDYFSANNSSGVGFFTVESYPIDDVNTANTSAITTAHIPLYVSENGEKLPLRDYVDFRPVATITAADTGSIDVANTSQVATAVTAATVNPSSTETVTIPSGGLNPPTPGMNFQGDVTYYLPRKDLFYLTPSTQLKIKEGASSLAPQTPLFPENGMAVSVLNIPAYPSLTSDQMDELSAINSTSRNLVRNTTEAVSSTLVTNRKYTMRDIGALDRRITSLEYYASLSLLEKQAADMTVLDQNGLDRFKNGIFVEPFNNHTLGDVSNPEYRIAIDGRKGVARPAIIREVVELNFTSGSSTGVQKTGRAITLPYTEATYLSQPYATKYRNAAPAAFKWNGTAQLIPSYTNHADTVNTGSIQVVQDNTQAWRDFAATPFATIYGDWQTSTQTTVDVVVTGEGGGPNIVVKLNQALFDLNAPQGGAAEADNYRWVGVAAREQGIALPDNFVIADVIVDQGPFDH